MNCKIINLAQLTKSDIKYRIDCYPDGHKHIILEQGWNKYNKFYIITRFSSMDDLFILLQVIKTLSSESVEIEGIFITYYIGARCDRRFSINEANDNNLITSIINNQTCARIKVLEKHSLTRFEDHCCSLRNVPIFKILDSEVFNPYKCNIVFPDNGAYERYRDWLDASFIGNKHRNEDKISIELFKVGDLVSDQPICVIDDLCDGGGTFKVLYEKLKIEYPSFQKILFVTHAIQKKALEELAELYDIVITTNSFKDWTLETFNHDNIKIIDIITPITDQIDSIFS